jgi:hypothetical protein
MNSKTFTIYRIFRPRIAYTRPPITMFVAVCNRMLYMVNLPGITSSQRRNPLEEWSFRWELPAHERGIY